jgi:drug/metabolite transporter (DMT)-like permease
MSNARAEQQHEVDISEKIFANAPNMLMLCLTAIGLIKIYTRFEKITTLADNFLSFVSLGFLIATILSYVALRSESRPRRIRLARAADLLFLGALGCVGAVALFVTFTGLVTPTANLNFATIRG